MKISNTKYIWKCFSCFTFMIIVSGFSGVTQASDAVVNLVVTEVDVTGDVLDIELATQSGKNWNVQVERDSFLGDDIPLISVSVMTGEETQIGVQNNCYFRTVTDGNYISTVAFIKHCSADIWDIKGFIADSEFIYIIEADESTPTGLSVHISEPGTPNEFKPDNETNNGWKKGGSGGNEISTQLIPRRSGAAFPSLEVYADPDFVAETGEENYVDRILEQLAFTNFAYAQSGINQVNLIAITRTDAEVGRNESALNLLKNFRRLRNRTMQVNSADIAGLVTGKDRSNYGYWGYAEIGGSCDLRITISEGNSIYSPSIDKGVFVAFDLKTLMQRGWTMMHEMAHTLDAEHVLGDYVMDANIVLVPQLSAYKTTCPAKVQFLRSCKYNPINKKLIDYYECP